MKDKLPDKLKRLGVTIRTIIQIIKALLRVDMMVCETCGGTDFERRPEPPDYTWLERNIPHYRPRRKGRSPPKSSTTGSKGAGSTSATSSLAANGRSVPITKEKSLKTPTKVPE